MSDTYGATPPDAFTAGRFPTAPGADAMGSRPPSSDPLDADYRQTINDIRGSMRDQAATLQEKQKAIAPIRQQQIDMLRQPLPQAPQTQAPPQPPKQRGPGDDETWLAAVGVLGAIAGGLTRNHATNALAAMTGAMEGYNEGSKTKFDQQMKQWEVENKAILETNKQANDRYLAILNSRKLALEQKSQELQLTAAQYDDRAAMQLAQTKNFETLGRLIEQRMSHQEKVSETHEKLAQQRELFDARLEADKDKLRMRMGIGVEGSHNEELAKAIARGDVAAPNSRSPQALALMERVLEHNPNYKQTDFTGNQAYARTAGSMSARVESASNEVAELAPLAIDASRNLPRGQFVPINKLIQMGQSASSNPAYNNFLIRNASLARAFGRAMNPQGIPRVTEAQEAKAEGMLNMAISQKAYETQVAALMSEVAASKRATTKTREGIERTSPLVPDSEVSPVRPAPSGLAPRPSPSNTTSTGIEWSVQ